MNKINFYNKTKVVDLTQEELLPESLTIMKVDCLKEEKNMLLLHFLRSYPKEPTIIFTNSISSSKRVKSFLEICGNPCISLHAEMQ